MKRALYKAPHYAVFSTLPSLPPSFVQIFSALCLETPLISVLPLVWETKFHTRTGQRVKLRFYVYREETGRRKTLNRVVASIPGIYSSLKVLRECSFDFSLLFPNAWTFSYCDTSISGDSLLRLQPEDASCHDDRDSSDTALLWTLVRILAVGHQDWPRSHCCKWKMLVSVICIGLMFDIYVKFSRKWEN